MAKLWTGRFAKETDQTLETLNASLPFDQRLYKQDITGSMAHARMLAHQGIISSEDQKKIQAGLESILADIETGTLKMVDAEDIHTFVEQELTARIGDAGKRLHTARSRNDQVALDLRMYTMEKTKDIMMLVLDMLRSLCDRSKEHLETVMPGYTHLQRAQPVTVAHVWMAYANMLKRDYRRLSNALELMDEMPLGSGALASTTYPIDRQYVCDQLGFARVTDNSMDGVSDRDYCMEMASDLSILMMHLSRMCEEIILWCSWEFRFVELDDAFSTGSSIMPQKKNPDVCELIRGKTGRVYGHLMTLLTMQKGLSLAYNKDMQEDKEALFDILDTVENSLKVMIPMFDTMKIHKDVMKQAALGGFINATDCADYLTMKGIPFRDAYKTIGQLVAYCIEHKLALNEV
ncbi:MAG: argininosuccinate lyase, partial [Erysipelotrichaceae bacterium]|nr:argininosuccinate lyase [Erysipelotrichaceae bacterium]